VSSTANYAIRQPWFLVVDLLSEFLLSFIKILRAIRSEVLGVNVPYLGSSIAFLYINPLAQ
jgi:hypothetical protein